MDVPVLVKYLELIYTRSVWTLDVVWKTCRERWMIGTDIERESGRSMLSAGHDDDDDEDDE